MNDPWTRLIAKEAGGGDGVRRGRTKGPRRRPAFVAHPCTDWDEEMVKEHLAACVSGRDPITGEWDFDPENPAEVWAFLWETMPRTRPDGTLDWGAWAGAIREVEVP
jgi:hypothetical protein